MHLKWQPISEGIELVRYPIEHEKNWIQEKFSLLISEKKLYPHIPKTSPKVYWL